MTQSTFSHQLVTRNSSRIPEIKIKNKEKKAAIINQQNENNKPERKGTQHEPERNPKKIIERGRKP